jgi:hypothetical protein
MGKRITITEKEKQEILKKYALNEILWDDANKKALSTWYRDTERKTYKIEILEPCVLEMNDETQYDITKFVLLRNKVKYNIL